MNFLLVILPAIISIGLLVGLIFIISKKKSLTVKITHWMLFIYVGVLVISTIIVPLMTKISIIDQEHLTEKEIDQHTSALFEKISAGKLAEIDQNHLLKHSSFEFDQPSLTLQYTGVEYPPVYIERIASNDPYIETYSLTSGLFIEGIDFSHQLDPYRFDLVEDELTIYPPIRDIIDVAMVKKEFPITQFLGGGMFFHTFQLEVQIIYLKVPQHVEIINASDLSIEYVKK